MSATNPGTLLFGLSLFALLLLPSHPMVGTICCLCSLLLGFIIFLRFQSAHTHEVHYSLDTKAAEHFAEIQAALSSLSSCGRVWVLNTQSSTADMKRNAGATTLITRKPVSIGHLTTRGFKPSLPVPSLNANGAVFHFLPDQVLLFTSNRYATIQYEQIKIEVASKRFIEEGPAPRDSTQVGTTWRFVNKNGGPDRRFNNNRQLPILQYGEITLCTATGLRVLLQTSSLERAQAFAAQLQNAPTWKHFPGERDSQSKRPDPSPPSESIQECYALLGIRRPATLAEAAAAYRHQASLYHPDKYDHLAPEMKALASVRMEAINAAYGQVKLDITD